jgi:phage baseplate assembly protein W
MTSTALSDEDRDLLRRHALGWSAACEPIAPGVDLGRDLRLVADDEGRVDLARVRSMDNLAQTLTLAFTTLRGSDVFDTEFGFDGLNALVEERQALLVRERVRVSAVSLLMRDPRVRRVVDVQLDDGRLTSPATGAARRLEVRVVFETVTGDRQTVDLAQGDFRG